MYSFLVIIQLKYGKSVELTVLAKKSHEIANERVMVQDSRSQTVGL